MKTKFDSLVKIKKQDLDKQEIEIAKCNNFISQKQAELCNIQADLLNLDVPKKGNYWDFRQMSESKKMFLIEIDEIQSEISNLKNHLKNLKDFYKVLSIEYEKIKYLQENEIKKQIQDLKRIENKNFDEIGTMLFNLK